MDDINLSIDDLARQVAHECFHEHCLKLALCDVKGRIIGLVKEELVLAEDEKKRKHDEFFGALSKAISPYEKEFGTMVESVWDEEERIIIANIKKMKKAWVTKDAIDRFLYPVGIFERKLAEGANLIFMNLMAKEGERIAGFYDFDMVFDVQNPAVQKWLESYTPMFSKKLEAVNIAKLRAELTEGMRAGESIKELAKRISGTYDNWSRYRSLNIARSETLRASNASAKFVYKQSGLVKKILWITQKDDRTCGFCFELDGKVIDIEDNFFNLGDTFSIESEGKRQSMDIDYTDVGYPPLHSSCRCSISALIED